MVLSSPFNSEPTSRQQPRQAHRDQLHRRGPGQRLLEPSAAVRSRPTAAAQNPTSRTARLARTPHCPTENQSRRFRIQFAQCSALRFAFHWRHISGDDDGRRRRGEADNFRRAGNGWRAYRAGSGRSAAGRQPSVSGESTARGHHRDDSELQRTGSRSGAAGARVGRAVPAVCWR